MTDSRSMSCSEVLGGNRRLDQGLVLPDLDAWVLNHPAEGAEEGGDLVYVSVCGMGNVSKAYLADVAGHGGRVAHIARALRDLVRDHLSEHDAQGFLRDANGRAEMFEGLFATVVAVTHDRKAGRLVYAYAGHPHLLLKSGDGEGFRTLDPDYCPIPGVPADLAVGMVAGVEYMQSAVPFAAGDVAVLFSDGFVEAPRRTGGRAGPDDLLAAANHARTDSAENFRRDLLGFYRFELGVEAFEDDVSLVVLRRA